MAYLVKLAPVFIQPIFTDPETEVMLACFGAYGMAFDDNGDAISDTAGNVYLLMPYTPVLPTDNTFEDYRQRLEDSFTVQLNELTGYSGDLTFAWCSAQV
jgi:hypothetical protein